MALKKFTLLVEQELLNGKRRVILLKQGCEVVDVENNERLVKTGSIGAMLRYKF